MMRPIVHSVLALLGAMLLGMFVASPLLRLLVGHLPANTALVYFRPYAMLVMSLKLAFVAGIGLALPVILSQLRLITAGSPRPPRPVLRHHSLLLAGVGYYAGIAIGLVAVLPMIQPTALWLSAAGTETNVTVYAGIATGILFALGSLFAAPGILLTLAPPPDQSRSPGRGISARIR